MVDTITFYEPGLEPRTPETKRLKLSRPVKSNQPLTVESSGNGIRKTVPELGADEPVDRKRPDAFHRKYGRRAVTERTDEASEQGPSRSTSPRVTDLPVLRRRLGQEDQKILGSLQTSGANGVKARQNSRDSTVRVITEL